VKAACALLALVLALGLVACGRDGGGASASNVLSKTASNLGKIKSGEIRFSLRVKPRSEDAKEFGFELSGPFSLEKGALPVADVDYTQIANGKRATVKVLATGRRAYVEVGGNTYELPEALAGQLRVATGELEQAGGLAQLDVSDWVRDPHASDGGEVGGADTDHVDARLNVVAVVNDLLSAAGGLTGGLQRLQGVSAQRLQEAVRGTSFDLYSGKDDHLLRKLALSIDLAFEVPKDLRQALGDLVGAEIDLELEVTDPNKKVTVSEPANPRPYSELKR
jgi:hypothetical protein